MHKKKTLYILVAILVVEALVIVALPARVPRAVRALTAATDLIVAAALWLFARQNSRGE